MKQLVKKTLHRLGYERSGFTLVEMMISVAIFGVMTMIVLAVVTTATTTQKTSEARIVSQQDLRRALSSMLRELSETSRYKIDIPLDYNKEITFQIPVRPTTGSLAGQLVDANDKIIWGARPLPSTDPDGEEGYAIQYYIEPNNDISESNLLMRRVLDGFPTGNQVGDAVVVANFISSLEFYHQDFPYTASTLKKHVTLCHVPPGNPGNRHTIDIAQSAVKAHMDHGCYLGRCIGDEAGPPAGSKTLLVIVSAVKNNKLNRDIVIQGRFGISLRNSWE